MPLRITTESDLSELNQALQRVDSLRKQVTSMIQELGAVKKQVAAINVTHAPVTTNNLVFTWTGASGTISWTQGFLQDKNATANKLIGQGNFNAPGVVHNHAILAGSTPSLTASTFYWIAWNPIHRQMVFSPDAGKLYQNTDNILICQIFTGTAGQTGVAGGGGSTGGTELSGAKYKQF